MPYAVVIVELDTTPPELSLGTPDRLPDGRTRIPYTIDEPELLAVTVNRAVSSWDGQYITTSEVLPQGGTLEVYAFVRDEVGNAARRRAVRGLKPREGTYTKSTIAAPIRPRGTAMRPSSGHEVRGATGEPQ